MSFFQDNNRTNAADLSESSMNRSSKNFVWEPYAISSPRKPVQMEEINPKKNQKQTDRDWLHAFVTYSPYRTSNQEYGAKNPMIHFIDTTQRNRSNPNDGRVSTNARETSSNSNPNGSPRSSSQWK